MYRTRYLFKFCPAHKRQEEQKKVAAFDKSVFPDNIRLDRPLGGSDARAMYIVCPRELI